jgi:glutamate formiminotransferase
VPLIECVPNVSEGRRAEIIERCAEAIRATPARLLDVSSDPIHHRTVYTFVGEAAAVESAVHALFEAALPAIDLRQHAGVHPRLGAVDVVPFAPLTGATMADCVSLARRVGEEVARRHELPVYLYEAAATRPERRRLEEIRRGGLGALAARMEQDAWRPDFGPTVPHASAGVSVVGARPLLVAYNVTLRSREVAVAKAIAAAIRQSSGGLPSVKAMGVDLPDRELVQVSMNLTDYERTSMADVFDRIASEAERLGVRVAGSEIVGLAPRAAFPPSAAERLKLQGNVEDRILENRMGTQTPPRSP